MSHLEYWPTSQGVDIVLITRDGDNIASVVQVGVLWVI